MVEVAIVGGNGRLGSVVREVIERSDDYAVHAILGSRSSPAELDGADLIVDVSTPAVSADIVGHACERGANILVGTSGWSAERIAALAPRIDRAGIGAVFVPNFSLGSVLATQLSVLAAGVFDSAEIIEAHHDGKIDAPSGTAVRTAEMIALARTGRPVSAPFSELPARGELIDGVPVHSLRRPGVLARQETIFSGPGETLSIVHDTVTPAAAYEPGIRVALDATVQASGITVGLEHFIGLGPALRALADRIGRDAD